MAYEISEYYKKHKGEAQWQDGEYTCTRTTMWSGPGCHNGCGVVYYTKNGKVEKIEGDPYNPFNLGKLCMRCINYVEAADSNDRLKWPLKRVGERGENKWERISWDEAYDIIVEKVNGIKKDYGPESIVCMEGTGRNVIWQVPYLCYAAFGSPNFTLGFLSGESCSMPRLVTEAVTEGEFTFGDYSAHFPDRYENPNWKLPEVILLWGQNAIISNPDSSLGHWIVECMKRGSKLIVVDPMLTWLAAKADIWLRVRPGTDAALAMAMNDVIIKEDLYDHAFVEKWCHGFDDFAERVATMPPERAAEICWIPKDTIVEAARLYGKAERGAGTWGVSVDMAQCGISAAQAINALWAICGNLDKPGGQSIIRYAFDQGLAYDYGIEILPPEVTAKRIGMDLPLKQFGFGATAHSDTLLKVIEAGGVPYPIKMFWFQSTNPIANMGAEAPRLYKAIKTADFNVVVDMFMTPTAVAFADLVLPCAMSSERWSQRNWWMPTASIRKVASYYEAKSDEQLILELGKRFSPELFPWKDDKEWIDWIISDQTSKMGMTFDELCDVVCQYEDFEYYKYEKGMLRPDGKPGFNTPTGKVELKLSLFEAWGLDPLPWYQEPPESPYSTPELHKKYPLVLTTGHRSWEFFHSEHRQLKLNREFHPDPMIKMNPETAAKFGVKEGDWVWVENYRGRFKQKVKYEMLHPGVVNAEHGWWFPEKEAAEPSLYGVFDSNCNNLTTMCQNGPTGYGAPYKNQLCTVYKVTEENSKIMPTEQVTRLGGFNYVQK
ncbi:molybdopterin-dependent oxidoreductase [Dehalobacter sp. DCM]|uniref:molybdopterin-dependent oxidoreductase n=1 Tax=Dehalobacter sp. DCM TaxID=2907827 RepID=UPI0030817F86|nr:molybdopterin-dependent oxidoreductase [Dehalobacter sp. DCM]